MIPIDRTSQPVRSNLWHVELPRSSGDLLGFPHFSSAFPVWPALFHVYIVTGVCVTACQEMKIAAVPINFSKARLRTSNDLCELVVPWVENGDHCR